jgi:hypothetical protein
MRDFGRNRDPSGTRKTSEGPGHGSPERRPEWVDRHLWLAALRRYVAAIAILNLIWEFAQLPLYTIWWDGSIREILFAALHCTAGDIVIATLSLIGALLLVGTEDWPSRRSVPVTMLAVAAGIAYTIFSEWLNTEMRGSWAYTELMPTLPVIGTGLVPLMQWIVLPPLALAWSRRSIDANRVEGARHDANSVGCSKLPRANQE